MVARCVAAGVDPMFETALKEQKEAAAGVIEPFSLIGDTAEAQFSKPPEVKNRTSKLQMLLKEKELLGFFLTGHPLNAYGEVLKRLSAISLDQIEEIATEQSCAVPLL